MDWKLLTKKNKIAEGLIPDGFNGHNLAVSFHKMDSEVYILTPSGCTFRYCSFVEWSKENSTFISRIKNFRSYPEIVKYEIEYTDTFCGEANYAWCHRKTIEIPESASDLALIRKAKKAMGIKIKHNPKETYGDTIELDFRKYNTRMFITAIPE